MDQMDLLDWTAIIAVLLIVLSHCYVLYAKDSITVEVANIHSYLNIASGLILGYYVYDKSTSRGFVSQFSV